MNDKSNKTSLIHDENNSSSSSWNFNDLQNNDEIIQSNDFFSVLKNNITKHVYSNNEITNDKLQLNKTNEQNKTIHIDSSNLISRCKNFLPLLTNENEKLFSKVKSGENVRIELDSDQDDEKIIEMNLMFCPNIDSSSDSDNDDQISISPSLKFINKKNQVNIIEIIQDDNKTKDIVNN